MQTILTGLFDRYDQAESAVRDLEIAGILGEQVEVISDPDRDARSAALGMKPHESFTDRIARFLSGSRKSAGDDVYDAPGNMPDYIGEQEFYANHVRNEGAIVIVRVNNDNLAYLGEAILNKNGSKTRDGKQGVATREQDSRPHAPGQ